MENLSKSMATSPEVVIAPTTSSNQFKDFLNSNNFIAKISFLFLIIFIVVVLFQLIMRYLLYLYSPPKTVKLIDGVINASQMRVINQDITQSPSMLVTPSSNQKDGIEFTWSVWIFVNSLDTPQNIASSVKSIYHNIFFKGIYHPYEGTNPNCISLNTTSNAPGLYLIHDTNTTNSAVLQVLMDTYTQPSTFISESSSSLINECYTPNPLNIPHIPLNVWVSVVIRCNGQELDAYINGTIANSITLPGVPKQNYGNVYVAANGGFNGNIASLTYMNRSASNQEIWNIYKKGPSKKMLDSNINDITPSNYLSFGWYLAN
jgi:hypothetical protein